MAEERDGEGMGADAGCVLRAPRSELLIKTNFSDPDPPLSSSRQPSLHSQQAILFTM